MSARESIGTKFANLCFFIDFFVTIWAQLLIHSIQEEIGPTHPVDHEKDGSDQIKPVAIGHTKIITFVSVLCPYCNLESPINDLKSD